MIKNVKTVLIWVTIFSIAMGLLESAVVVYLRELYYPGGFDFPLSTMSGTIAITEILREAATLIMLVAIGILAGRTNTEKFGYFIYSFAIWDIFYYVFLKLLLNWPESLMTWDILFLLPTTWVGSVITPVLLSLAMIVLTLAIIYFTTHNPKTKINRLEWCLLIIGSVVCIVSFTYEYSGFLLNEFSFFEMVIPSQQLMDYAITYIPQKFPWFIFWLGFTIIITTITGFIKRNYSINKKPF